MVVIKRPRQTATVTLCLVQTKELHPQTCFRFCQPTNHAMLCIYVTPELKKPPTGNISNTGQQDAEHIHMCIQRNQISPLFLSVNHTQSNESAFKASKLHKISKRRNRTYRYVIKQRTYLPCTCTGPQALVKHKVRSVGTEKTVKYITKRVWHVFRLRISGFVFTYVQVEPIKWLEFRKLNWTMYIAIENQGASG